MIWVYCEREKHFKPHVVCLYRCSLGRRLRCVDYAKRYYDILEEGVDTLYIEKYGDPPMDLPYLLREKRKKPDPVSIKKPRSTAATRAKSRMAARRKERNAGKAA